jgi:hypothetical protein
MNANLHQQVYESMDQRQTEDLIEIWRANDRVDWSDEAFEVISEILQSRGVQLPEQNEPVLQHEENTEDTDDTYGLTAEDLKIIDDENPPDFYDPLEVLSIARWLRIAAAASIVLALLSGMGQLSSIVLGGASFRQTGQLLVAGMMLLVSAAFQVAITFLPLRALAYILRILMQMEFNSRKPGRAA